MGDKKWKKQEIYWLACSRSPIIEKKNKTSVYRLTWLPWLKGVEVYTRFSFSYIFFILWKGASLASLGEEPRNSERVGRLTSYLDTILFTENSVQNFTEKGQVPLDHP